MKGIHQFLATAMTAVTLLFPHAAASAAEKVVIGPPPLIGGEVKYRVDKSNVEQYKDKLPEGLYRQIKEWGRVVQVFDTVRDYKFPKEYMEATEKYKGTARINNKGGLENYIAGLPFPDPKTGAEAMYNYEYKYNGDDFTYYTYDLISYSTTGKWRKVSGSYARLGYQGRIYLDPKPSIPNSSKVELKEISALTYPEDVAGLALLTVRYQDPDKGDDGWMYIPTIRRVRRISVAQRGDTFGGTDVTWDDYRGFSGKVSDYSWKLIGKKEILATYHAVTYHPQHKGGMIASEDLRFEQRPVVIVEGVNKLKDYIYSKRRIYLDVDSWTVIAFELYDRRGALWKYGEVGITFDPRNNNAFGNHFYLADLIAKRSTLTVFPEKTDIPLQALNRGLKEDYFTPARIQTWGR